MIGIYGGTFDPIHYGHLRTALEVKEAVGLAEVRFIPCREPPHRNPPEAAPEQRLALLQAALRDVEPGFRIDTRELDRPGPSYMVDTLASLRAELGAEPLGLILGLDAFAGLDRWHLWRNIFELAHVLVMQRPGTASELPDELRTLLEDRALRAPELLHASPAGRVCVVPVTQLEISASQIRKLIAAGSSPRYLIPDPVIELIRRFGLYGSA